MTSKRLAVILRELTPTEFSDNVLLMWISNCENTILTDVMLVSEEDCVELTELSDAPLTVPHPWDKLYLPYMQAQVAHANGEYDHYANYIALYNAYLEEYTRHIIETVNPSGGRAVRDAYYLSAYAIAVEHGFVGTVEEWLASLTGKQGDKGDKGDKGDTGDTSLPVASGRSEDGVAYVAAGENLPDVKPGSNGTHAGKGKQIIFIPEYPKNKSESPALQINGGDLIQIRMRAPKNQGGNDQSPCATLPVPVGALMVGVPYTMTFCGLYWLVDSQIAQYACAEDQSQANLLREQARQLVLLSESDAIGMPIINSADGVGTAKARIKRSAEEDASPDVSGNVTLPTEARVKELTAPCVVNMTKNADGTYTADKTFAELKTAHDAGRTVICSFNDLTQQWDSPFMLPVVCAWPGGLGFAGVIEPEQNYQIFARVYINSVGMGYTATEISDSDPSAVHYTAEEKTEKEKSQARTNIGAEAAPVELTWDREVYPDLLSFLRTISKAGRYTFSCGDSIFEYSLVKADLPDEGTIFYGTLKTFCAAECNTDTTIYAGESVETLEERPPLAPATQAYVDRRLPKSTTDDKGKVLMVSDDGKASWTAVANAEEVAV